MERSLRGLAREPLVHFLLIGAALFVIWAWRGAPDTSDLASIVVSPARIEQLAAGFERTWQRPPTRRELSGLVDEFVREEIYYREALALGLDRDDTVIRRRLRQKMEFLSDDVLAGGDPMEAELEGYLEQNPETFRVEPRVSFRQIYLNPERRGASIESDARTLLARLEADGGGDDAANLGDTILLPADFELYTPSDIRRSFGEGFAEGIFALEPGRWSGPVVSGYGLHLVLVRERVEGRAPALEEVRREVEREWREARRRTRREELYARLLERYRVEIEWPEDGPDTATEPAAGTASGGSAE